MKRKRKLRLQLQRTESAACRPSVMASKLSLARGNRKPSPKPLADWKDFSPVTMQNIHSIRTLCFLLYSRINLLHHQDVFKKIC